MLALPAAVAAGIVLPQPAQAQTIIDVNKSSTVNLSGYQTGNPFTISAGTTISTDASGGISVSAPSSVPNVTNNGIILSNATASHAIDLSAGGSIVNTGTIYGADAVVSHAGDTSLHNTGIITGYHGNGVALSGSGVDQVQNAGGAYILGAANGVLVGGADAQVDNSGTITGNNLSDQTANGIYLQAGGVVTNAAGGYIIALTNGINIEGHSGSVYNSGAIVAFGDGSNGTGVLLGDGGNLSNRSTGTIFGGEIGLELDAPGTVQNAGAIIGNAGTGLILNGGILTNAASGVINGGGVGLNAADGAVVINAGTIMDSLDAGAILGDHVSLTNTGLITGVTGLVLAGTDVHAVNAGTINSTDAGNAISFAGTGDVLTLTTGSVLTGGIDGGGTDGQIVLDRAGTLTNSIDHFGEAGGLDIVPGARWTASGSWTIPLVSNAGSLQPGILGTNLTLTGNFTQGPGGSLAVLVTPALSSQFNVSGTAKLAGSVIYYFAPGTYAPKTSNFLNAADITGRFARVVYAGYDPASLQPQTAILAHSANLVLAAGGIVTPADDGLFADTNQILAAGGAQVNTTLLGKAVQNTDAEAAICAPVAGASAGSRMIAAIAGGFCRYGGWVEATGTAMNADSKGGGYNADAAGFLAGIDRPVNRQGTKLGLAIGYEESWLQDANGGKASAGTMRIGVYGAQPLGRFTLAADVTYGHANGTTLRATGVGQAEASHGSDIFSGAAQLSTNFAVSNYSFMPEAGIRFATISAGGFNEQASGIAAPFAVTAAASHYTSIQPFLRLDISRRFTVADELIITPDVNFGGTIEAADRGKPVNLTAQDGTEYVSSHTDLDAGMAQIGAGIKASRHNWSLFARYAADISGNWTAQTGEAGLQIRF